MVIEHIGLVTIHFKLQSIDVARNIEKFNPRLPLTKAVKVNKLMYWVADRLRAVAAGLELAAYSRIRVRELSPMFHHYGNIFTTK